MELKAKHQRKFGKWVATITEDGVIDLTDGWVNNHGVIYPHAIVPTLGYRADPVTKQPVQVIGMDNPIPKSVYSWIIDKIRAGHFNHLDYFAHDHTRKPAIPVGYELPTHYQSELTGRWVATKN